MKSSARETASARYELRSERRGPMLRCTALLGLAMMLAACTRGAVDELPAPPTTRPITSTTARPDLSGVALAGVPGATTTSVLLGPGKASFDGIVVGPSGPVPGATVLLERQVGDGISSATLITGADGRWKADAVLGGRWRVRAWRAPDLALTVPETIFLEEAEDRKLEVTVAEFTGVVVTASVAPAPPIVDELARIVVRAFTRSVREDGVVSNEAVPFVELSLAGSSQWRVESSNPTSADSSGQGEWLARCASPGSHALAVRVAGGSPLTLKLPACALTPEEPAAEEEADSGSGSTTSTSRRRPSSTTTENQAASG